MLNIMSPELVRLITESSYLLTHLSSFPPNPQALVTTILLSVTMSLTVVFFVCFVLFLIPYISEIIQCLSFCI